MSELSKTEQYIALRLEGAGHREASREAGFVNGSAPKSAIRSYRYAVKVRSDSRAVAWIQSRLAKREQEVAELREHLRVARFVERLGEGGV